LEEAELCPAYLTKKQKKYLIFFISQRRKWQIEKQPTRKNIVPCRRKGATADEITRSTLISREIMLGFCILSTLIMMIFFDKLLIIKINYVVFVTLSLSL